jgi:hypothetical protein
MPSNIRSLCIEVLVYIYRSALHNFREGLCKGWRRSNRSNDAIRPLGVAAPRETLTLGAPSGKNL